jgi:hypothetical protein
MICDLGKFLATVQVVKLLASTERSGTHYLLYVLPECVLALGGS